MKTLQDIKQAYQDSGCLSSHLKLEFICFKLIKSAEDRARLGHQTSECALVEEHDLYLQVKERLEGAQFKLGKRATHPDTVRPPYEVWVYGWANE